MDTYRCGLALRWLLVLDIAHCICYQIETMTKYPSETGNAPVPSKDGEKDLAVDSVGDEKNPPVAEHLETNVSTDASGTGGLHKKAAIAVIKQQHTIPATGKRVPTSKLEYVLFCIFCEYSIHL